MEDLNTEIKIGADASGVEAGVSKAKRSLKDLGDAASRAGKDAGAGIGSIGAGGDKSAKDVERATRSMQGSLQRLLAEQKAGAKGSREYWEALANARGVNKSAIKPILDQLDAAKAKTLSAKAASESWTSSLSKIGPVVAAAFSGAVAVGFVGKLVAVQREFDVLNSSLKTVTGSSEAAEREMAWLKDFAKTTPFGLAQATQGFVKMKALGLDPTRAALTSFGNTASAMGKGLDQMIEAVADASTGEFERLKEFGIKAKKDGDSVSLTFRGVTTTIKNSAQEITQYLEGIGNVDFAGAMVERAKTLDGAIAGLGDTWDELFRTVSSQQAGSLIFDGVTLASGAIEDAITLMKAFSGATSDATRESGALASMQGAVGTFFETVAVLAANTLYVLKQTGDTLGGLAAGYKAFFSFNFGAVRSIGADMKANGEAARKELDATIARILSARKEQERYASYSTRNASAATDPRRVDAPAPRRAGGSGGTGGSGGSKSGSNAAASALKSEQSAYESLMTSIRTKIELDKAELAGNAALTESQQMRVKLDADMVGGRLKLSAAHEQEVRTALAALGVSEALMKARKLELEQATAAAEAYASALESRQAAAESVADQIAQERESIATMGLSKTAVVQLEAAKLSETAATKLRLAAIADEIDWSGKLGNAYRAEAAQLLQLADLKREGAVKQASVDAAETASKEWDKTAENIESALTDALMRGFESGKSFGENLGDSISNYFKTTVAKEIASAITRAIMSAMASTQWGQMLSGALGGGGGGGDWMSMASNAYSAYSSGAAGGAGSAGAAGSMSAIGSYLGGSMSGANTYGSIYANTTGTGLDGLLSTNGSYGTAYGSAAGEAVGEGVAAQYGTTVGSQQTAMLAAQESGMGAGAASGGAGAGAGGAASSWMAYMGYAALIAAAVMVASNLYEKGYTRMALGEGGGEKVNFGQYSSYTTDPNIQKSWMNNSPAMLMTNDMRKFNDALGMSSKWADILSGTTRMATLVGRKLGAYGYQADIAGGDSETSGFARYKGGLFRSNKTVKADVDPRDAAAFDAVVESTIEGSRAMARAMGYSEDAINKYTGSLKVNFKGAETAEEQAKRMAEAMDELQFSLLKAAAGGKYSREEFDKMMEGVRASMEAVGITTAGIADILVQGMTGRLSQADVGDRLSEVIVGGIYNAIAGNYAGVIAQAFTSQIITPIFTALAAGVPISQAISQAAIQNVVATAQNAAAALNAVFSDPGFRQAIAGIESAISSVSVSVTRVKPPSYGGRAAKSAAVDQSAQQRYQLETQLLTLLGNTTRLRQRELAGLSAGNRALQIRIWALEDAKSAVESAMGALERSIEAQRDTVQKQLDAALESESMLNDVFDTLRENIRELRGDVTSTAGIGAAEGRSKILQAISGAITLNNDDLTDAIGSVRDSLDAQAFASKFERDRANLAFAGELDSLAGVTEKSLSQAEQTVSLLEDQLTSLDATLELAQKQVDALFGVDTSVKTVANAVMALNVSMAGYAAAVASAQAVATSGGAAPGSGGGSSGGGGGGGGGSSAPRPAAQWTAEGYWSKNVDLQKEYANLLTLDPKQTDPRFTKDEKLSYRDEYLAWHWNTIGKTEKRRYAKGGYYPGGMALVGEEGPELINFKQPGQVYTARQTADLMRGDGANSDVVKELRELRSEQRAQASAMVGVQMKLNKIVSRWDAAGMPEVRVLA